MTIEWQPIETTPKDIVIIGWDMEEGAVKMYWCERFGKGYWRNHSDGFAVHKASHWIDLPGPNGEKL